VKHGSPYKSPARRNGQEAKIVLDAIRRIVQVLRIVSRAGERDVGLSAAQLFVLDRLASARGALSVNELAERTLTHQSSVSVVVQKLEQRGLIERMRSARDARRVELSLSPAARKLLRKAPQAAQDRIIDAVNAMPSSDRRRLAQLLGALAAKVGDEAGAPAMFFEDEKQQANLANLKRGARRVRRP
jgi:DNA-binding MarR family transcriptional regulator